MKQWLRGKKTYIVAIAAILTAIAGYVEDQITLVQLIESIFIAVGGITLRAAISKV